MTDIKPKRAGGGLDVRTFYSDDEKETPYVVYKAGDSYHVFVEVEAKTAAIECGSGFSQDENTHTHWNELWDRE